MRTIHSVDQLLELHDEQFIHAVYQILLLRSPDNDAKTHLLRLLRSGRDKGTLLLAIALSHEARLANANLPGLASFIKRRQHEKIFLIGFFIKLFRIIVGCYYQLNRLENMVGRLTQAHLKGDLGENLSGIESFREEAEPDLQDTEYMEIAHFSPRAYDIFRQLERFSKISH